MRIRRGSLCHALVLLLAAVATATVAALSQSPIGAPSAVAAPGPDSATGAEFEDVDARTRTSATFRQSDGSMITRVSAAPMHLRQNGRWVPIDSTLHAQPDGSVGPATTGYDLALPTDLTEPVEVSGAGPSVAFQLRGAAAGSRVVDGNRVTYADVFSGVDVDYTAGPESVKEELVLSGPDSRRRFAFDLTPDGDAKPRLEGDGSVSFVNPDGTVQSTIARPIMVDDAGAASPDLAYSLRQAGTGWRLGLDANSSWLRAAERAWPVRVDPTVTFATSAMRTINPADTASNSSHDLVVARAGAPMLERGLARFAVPTSVPRSARVRSAILRTEAFWADDAGWDLDVYEAAATVTNSASWGSNGMGQAWSGGLAADGSSRLASGATDNDMFYVDATVQRWVRDPSTNTGLVFKFQNESTCCRGPRYVLAYAASPPVLEVEWEDETGSKPNWTLDELELSDRTRLAVNVAGGNLVYRANDVAVDGVGGMDLGLERAYDSRSGRGTAGRGWFLGTGLDTTLTGTGRGMLLNDGHTVWRFGQTGNPTVWTSPPAVNATLRYPNSNRRVTFHRTGETWGFDWNTNDKLTWREDKNGHRITYGYDAARRLSQITDTHGRVYTIGRNTAGLPTSITDATYPGGARTWQYGYSTSGSTTNLTTYTDPEGKVTTYGYAPGTSTLTQITDPRGNRTKLTYTSTVDPGGFPRVASIQRMTNTDWNNPVGPKTTYSYDLVARTTTVTAPNGNVAGATPSQHQTTYHWNEATLEVDHVRNRLGQWEQTSRSQNGDVTRSTSQGSGPSSAPGGGTGTAAVTDIAYDGNDNPIKTEAPGVSGATGGARETRLSSYYGPNDLHGGQPASPATGQYRQKSGTDEQGNVNNFSYDAAGNLTRSSQGPAVQANLAYTTAADAPVPKGLLKTATDGKGQVTTYVHNAAGDLTSVKPPLTGGIHSGEFTFTYEPATNRRATQTDASGVMLTYSYDKLDRVTRIANSNGQRVDYGYDANGNLTSRTWGGTPAGGGANATYVYDALNRRTSETIAGVTTTYSFDANGNLASMVDGGGTTSYGYDRLDRVTTITPPAGGAITAAYDDTAVKRTRTWTYPGGQKQRTDYALSGKTVGVTALNSTGGVIKSLEYGYAGPTAGSETFQRRSETQKTGGTVDRTFTYAYDTNNRLCWATTQTIAAGPFTVGACPNAAGAPAGAGISTWSYEWDAASNRTRTSSNVNNAFTRNETFGHNTANQLAGYSHDSRGNLTAGSLGYDAWNRPNAVGGTNLGYGTPDNTELVTDGPVTLRNTLLGMTTSTTGAIATHYIRTPDGEFVGERTSAGTRYAILDALGSTRWLLSGNTISRAYDYSPDGVPTVSGGSGADTRVRFAGGDFTTSQRYHYGARFYDSYLARWTQRDPLDQPDDLANANAYSYSAGNPVSYTDPSGLSIFGDALEFVGVAAGTAIACGTASTGVGAAGCVAGLTATSGAAANLAEGVGKARRKN